MTTSATKFTSAARVLAAAVADMQLVVPGFRSPPRIIGVNRTIKRSREGTGGIVAVRLSDRPFTAVIGDMIEGVLALNRLSVPEADSVRTYLWRVMLQFTVEHSPVSCRIGHEPSIARVA